MKPLFLQPSLLNTDVTGGTTIATFVAQRLDESNAESIARMLFDLVDRLGRHKLRLDLGAVEYLTSVVLGKLISLNKKVRAVGGELCLFNVRPQVYEIFEVTHLTKVLDIRPKDPVQDTPHVASA